MKKKKGFIFMETIIVLTVVALSLSMVLASYTLLTRKAKAKEYYNNVSDKYLLYSISKLAVNTNKNYNNILSAGASDNKFSANADNCRSTFMGDILGNACSQVFLDNNIKYIYVVYDLDSVLKNDPTSFFDNGSIDFVDTLDPNGKYMIGVFYRSGHYFYSSINL